MRKMFSEKQIKSIVNNGIDSGEIQIPASGTQLYLHFIEMDGEKLYVIDNDEREYTSPSYLANRLIVKDFIIANDYSASGSLIYQFDAYDAENNKLTYYLITSNSVELGTDPFNDTVTPL